MQELFDWLLHNYDWAAIGTFIGALIAIFTFYKQVGIPMYNATLRPMVQFFQAVGNAPKRIDNIDIKLDRILGELVTNTGSSIKDQLNHLSSKVSLGEAQRLLMLNSNENGISTTDAEGNYTWINDTLMHKVGAESSNEMLGDNWINTIHPADRKFVIEEWENAVKGKRSLNIHFRFINLKTQLPISAHSIVTPAFCFDGSLIGYNAIIYFT